MTQYLTAGFNVDGYPALQQFMLRDIGVLRKLRELKK